MGHTVSPGKRSGTGPERPEALFFVAFRQASRITGQCLPVGRDARR